MNRLKETRFFKGLGQWQLAMRSRTHQSRISLIENDLTDPKEEEKKRLAKALGVRPEDIFPELEIRKDEGQLGEKSNLSSLQSSR